MKGHVHIPAADMLRLRDAIHEAGACSAWNQIRHMADPDLKVAHANDGNHWADWQKIAATEHVPSPPDPDAECDCHRRMGNDFYFLPATACLIGDPKDCTDPVRNGRYVHGDRPRVPVEMVPDCFTELDQLPEFVAYPTPGECHHHRLTLHCPECAREKAATAGQQEHSEVLRAAGVPYHDDDAGEHQCVLDAIRQC